MDSNDRERINEAKEEVMRMLSEDELKEAVLLVLANKQVSSFYLRSGPHPGMSRDFQIFRIFILDGWMEEDK